MPQESRQSGSVFPYTRTPYRRLREYQGGIILTQEGLPHQGVRQPLFKLRICFCQSLT